jgi:exosortase sorting signal-containing protein
VPGSGCRDGGATGIGAFDSKGEHLYACRRMFFHARVFFQGGTMTRITAMLILFALALPAWAGANSLVFLTSVPTLDEAGLGALIAIIAGVAGWSVRRRLRK